MGKGAIAIIVAAGAAAWVYARFMRTTGSNTQTSLTAAAGVGALVFFIVFTVLGMLSSG